MEFIFSSFALDRNEGWNEDDCDMFEDGRQHGRSSRERKHVFSVSLFWYCEYSEGIIHLFQPVFSDQYIFHRSLVDHFQG